MVNIKLTALLLLSLLAALFAAVWGLLAALAGSRRAVRIAVAFDQAANAAIGGSEDETISSRAGKGAAQGVWHWCILCRLLDWLDPGHCPRSIEPDEGKPLTPSSPAQRGADALQPGLRRKLWLALAAFGAGLLALLVVRNLAGVTLAALLSGLSASAMASAKTAASSKGADVHLSAFLGGVAGSMMLWVQLRGRQLFDRVLLVCGSLVSAYFGGRWAAELWPAMGPGGVAVSGTVAAYLIVPGLEAALALLRDIPWIKRLVATRIGGSCDVAPQPPSTETVDNPVESKGGS